MKKIAVLVGIIVGLGAGIWAWHISQGLNQDMARGMKAAVEGTPPPSEAVAMPPLSGAVVQKFDPQTEGAVQVARAYIETHRQEWDIRPYHQLQAETNRTPLGTWVNFDISQDGVPLLGQRIQIRVDTQGQVKEVRNGYHPVEAVDVKTAFQSQAAFGRTIQSQNPGASSPVPILYYEPGSPTAIAAYAVALQDSQAVYRATDGRILVRSQSRKEFK